MRVCPQCRMPFSTTNHERRYCSAACGAAYRRQHPTARRPRPVTAPLTDDQVREIRARYANKSLIPVSMRALGAEYDVSYTAIHLIVTRQIRAAVE